MPVPWLATPDGPIYRLVCECGNPVITREVGAVECDAHGEPVCGIGGCRRPRMRGSRGSTYALCGVHAKRRYRHGDPFYEAPPLTPAYRTAHTWIRDAKGSASEFACVDCGGSAHDWSYVGGDPRELVDPRSGLAYSTDVDLYEPRCRGCHVEHDRHRDAAGRFTGRAA